jgi:malonyl CoA-acyl carrier protein transacylase
MQMKAVPGSALKRVACLRRKRSRRALRAAPMFRGGRGATAFDVPAAARLAVAAGELLLDQGLELLELNPVLVHEQGAVAVDAVAARSALP